MVDMEQTAHGMMRRTFVFGTAGCLVLFGMGGLAYMGSTEVCRPPGGQDDDHFTSLCIHCEKCREICPNSAIGTAHIEDGLLNVRTPKMAYSYGWCDFCEEANAGVPLCESACPTTALLLPEDARPETVIIGKAVINRSWCLGWQLMGCRICVDACPYQAIELDGDKRPMVKEDLCNGCGACENVCVSMENGSVNGEESGRAIVVEPLESA